MPKILFFLLSFLGTASAQEQLPSNFLSAVFPDGRGGIWTIASRQSQSVLTRLAVDFSEEHITLSVADTLQPGSWSPLPASLGSSLFSEELRVPYAARASSVWLGAFSTKNYGSPRSFSGLLHLGSGVGVFLEEELLDMEEGDSLDNPVRLLQLSAFPNNRLGAALGKGGLGLRDSSGNWSFFPTRRNPNQPLDTLSCSDLSPCTLIKDIETLDSLEEFLSIALDDSTGRLWVGGSFGLWFSDNDGSYRNSGHSFLDTARISGIWTDPRSAAMYVEAAQRQGDLTKSRLYFSPDRGTSFSLVRFVSNSKTSRTQLYDSLEVTLTSIAFVGKRAFASFRKIGGRVGGALFLSADTLLSNEVGDGRRENAELFFGVEDGISERDLEISEISAFEKSGRIFLAAATLGGGLSISADSGRSWEVFARRTAVSGGLKEVRIIPSVLRENVPVRVAYRLDLDSRIDIEIFNYAMEPVRTLLRSGQRRSDLVRSNNPSEDVWDGRDESGNRVSIGLYYIRVRDSEGNEAWGKVLNLAGRR